MDDQIIRNAAARPDRHNESRWSPVMNSRAKKGPMTSAGRYANCQIGRQCMWPDGRLIDDVIKFDDGRPLWP